VRCWSAGCASGEEPYTLNIAWRLAVRPAFPNLSFRVLATDADKTLLARARTARFPASSLKDLPVEWQDVALTRLGDLYCLKAEFRCSVEFLHQDIRTAQPAGPFHLILCRNLVFTYLDVGQQVDLIAKTADRLLPSGYLVIGIHELLPAGGHGLVEILPETGIYEKPATR